ncbi:MAG: SH3 domain-containing protein [Saprospiraceae bacterium]|nr:SH3 domain-containing protein [Saprospiraceae bacterium]
MPHSVWKIFPLCLFLSACQTSAPPENALEIRVEQTILREAPTEKSREIATLKKGELLRDKQETGPAESRLSMEGVLVQSPWIKVETEDGQTGWVLAWGLNPVGETRGWMLQKRFETYFGKALTQRCNTLTATFQARPVEQSEWAKLWQEARSLRDTCMILLAQRPETDFTPRYDWLESLLPGFVFQTVGAHQQPFLFADFRVWRQAVQRSAGMEDDAFFHLCMEAFPADSIESFFPCWKFQLSETESASQLGSGKHEEILIRVGAQIQAGSLFRRPLLEIKEAVLDDIFGKNIRYWQSQLKIMGELDRLLSNPPGCLDAREIEALRIRRAMFENPAANGIILNLRSG